MNSFNVIIGVFFSCFLMSLDLLAQVTKSTKKEPIALFEFDGNTNTMAGNSIKEKGTESSFVKGLEGKALNIRPGKSTSSFTLTREDLSFGTNKSFSVQFWIKTTMDAGKSTLILSQKEFDHNNVTSQKNAGWALYINGGTWAWNMGSGKRRITHERDNGEHMPINDGKWHQLAMTYNKDLSEIRLYYDGDNKALYHVSDSVGFEVKNTKPVTIGWNGVSASAMPEIEKGAEKLQELVNAFNLLGAGKIKNDELIDLVVDPKTLFEQKIKQMNSSSVNHSNATSVNFAPLNKIRSELSRNPYTVHQIKEFTAIAPLAKAYILTDGKVMLNQNGVKKILATEQFHQPEFDLDNLAFWDRTLLPHEVMASYAKYFKPVLTVLPKNLKSLTVADWNIWHGGLHFTKEKDGWDSRERISEILKKENADIILMQETYSSGDFIAAELGYYFATTIDWDYLNQGTNNSVLSRFPITELHVPKGASFMNVGVKIPISKTQNIYAMSNWYGMNKFPEVFSFHEPHFANSDRIPTLFAGDFNAVPHTDGGKSPASLKMLGSGFTDAFRNLYPDVQKYPGYSHNSGERIDQLYYLGKGLKNTETKIVTTWPSGFPSDHFLIISKFNLNYSSFK